MKRTQEEERDFLKEETERLEYNRKFKPSFKDFLDTLKKDRIRLEEYSLNYLNR